MTNIDSPEGVDTGDIVGGVVGFCVGELDPVVVTGLFEGR